MKKIRTGKTEDLWKRVEMAKDRVDWDPLRRLLVKGQYKINKE